MRIRVRAVSITLAACLLSAGSALAGNSGDWPSWSGPNLDFTSPAKNVFGKTGPGLERVWAQPLGSGYSGILVVRNRLITAFSDDASDVLVALDALTGDEIWRYRIGETYEGHDGSDDGPLATPTVYKKVVYGLGGAGELFAVRWADGEEVWARNIVDELGARPPLYGFATAPTVVSGVLIVQAGGSDGRSIVGLDPADGSLLWSTGDDAVTYQSPLALRVGGSEQVFAVTDRHLLGLDPRTGEILWTHEHGGEDSRGLTRAQPIPLGRATVLLTDTEDSVLYRIAGKSGRYEVSEVWRTRGLYRSFASPVPYEGHLYGYAGMSFLTCVDAETGETKWKSRAPGEGLLLLVDGHLLILAQNGDVVAVEATPDGYREKARVKALERGYFTRPTFAAGRIYVRNLREIAAVGVTEGVGVTAASTAASEPVPEPRGIIADLVQRVEQAQDKRVPVDTFMAAYPDTPVLDDDDLVHFIFRGEVDDLMVLGNMEPWEREQPMHRIEGTDLYYRSVDLEPGGRFEYAFAVFDDIRLDPLNPQRSEIDGRERSVLTTRGFGEAKHLAEPAGSRGRIDKLAWDSEIIGDEREVQVYLPEGYDESADRYPLLMFYGAQGALEHGLWSHTLDNLVGRSVEPIVVAFVPSGHWSESGSRASEFIRAMADELIPLLDGTYRTIATPEHRALMGNSFSGWFVNRLVIQRPDLFSKAATQSPVYGTGRRDALIELIDATDKTDLTFVVQWTAHEYRDPEGRTAGELLRATLQQKGYEPVANEIPGGLGWPTWRQTTNGLLESLFPLGRTPR
jgi:outer membrane protein assembly factor BamB